ncbi:hypothetical protein EVAR_768_1 [Eumeta japonica]|uniref:Uncharacterized protein n=1 Tax=Eumeta variegata TaxID=151549 RepID=A0A4C1SC31_EUMVA|nr:hypothetical protein EVAR_768_1 [Eumeta japonica]
MSDVLARRRGGAVRGAGRSPLLITISRQTHEHPEGPRRPRSELKAVPGPESRTGNPGSGLECDRDQNRDSNGD